MTALSEDGSFDTLQPGELFRRCRRVVANVATYYQFGAIALDSSGLAVKATAAANMKIVGWYRDKSVTTVAGDEIEVQSGIIERKNSGTDPVTIADLENEVYLEDDQTIARTSNGGTLSPCGRLVLFTNSKPFVMMGAGTAAAGTGAASVLYLHAPVADQTAMQAIAAADRADGTLCVDLTTNLLWQFDAGSAAVATAWVRVPAAGSGRWLRTNAGLTDLSSVASGYGASLIGVEASGGNLEVKLAAMQASIDAGMPVYKKTVTVGHADLTDAVNGEAQAINIGTALPNNSRIVGVDMRALTVFTGGSVSAVTCDVGTSGDVDALIAAADLQTAAVDGGPATMPAGVRPNKTFASGGQLIATFTPDGGHALLALSAGSVIIDVLYTVLA